MTCASTGRPAAGQLPEPWTDEVSSMLSTPPGTPTRLADARLAAARGQAASARPVGASPATGRSAATLLGEAAGLTRAPERYATAHRAALRAAAAVLAARVQPDRPGPRRSRPTSVWVLLPAIAPELEEWAAFFAAGAAKRAAAEAGLPRAVSDREADDLLRDAEAFLAVVEVTLGLTHRPVLPGVAVPSGARGRTG